MAATTADISEQGHSTAEIAADCPPDAEPSVDEPHLDGAAATAVGGIGGGSANETTQALPSSLPRRPLFVLVFMADPDDEGRILYVEGLAEGEATDLVAGNSAWDALDPDTFDVPTAEHCPLVVFEAEQLTADEWVAEQRAYDPDAEADPDYQWYFSGSEWRKATAEDLTRAGLLAALSTSAGRGEGGR